VIVIKVTLIIHHNDVIIYWIFISHIIILAFDVTVDGARALEDLIEMGFDRILTSGMEPTALEGLPRLEELVKQVFLFQILCLAISRRNKGVATTFLPSGQNLRKSSPQECIFDNMALYFNAELTKTHSFRLFLAICPLSLLFDAVMSKQRRFNLLCRPDT